jgi:hypothetical protein
MLIHILGAQATQLPKAYSFASRKVKTMDTDMGTGSYPETPKHNLQIPRGVHGGQRRVVRPLLAEKVNI